MVARSSLHRRILLGVVLPVLGLVTCAVLALMSVHRAGEARVAITQTQSALANLRRLQDLERQTLLAAGAPAVRGEAAAAFEQTWRETLPAFSADSAQLQRLQLWRDRVVSLPGRPVSASSEQVLAQLATNLPLAQALISSAETRLSEQQQAAQADLQSTRSGLLASAGVLAGLTLLLGLGLQRRVQGFVGRLRGAATQLQAGDFTVRLPTEGQDELAELAGHFNGAVAAMAHTLASQQDLQHSLETRVEALVHASTHELQLLSQLGTFMQACRDQAEAAAVIERIAPVVFPDGGSVALVEPSRRVLNAFAQWGDHSGVAAFLPDDCWSSRLGTAHETADMHPAPRCLHDQTHHATTCIPLSAQGETLGVITLHFHTVEDMERARELTRRFADRVALSLANVRLKTTLREQSVRDPLTGVFNRRHLDEVGERELARARRHGQAASVLLLDVDHFKQFNDVHGHMCGDEVLRQLAAELGRRFRSEDVVCRYGGEEFLVLLPDCGAQSALERAESLRQAVQSLLVVGGDGGLLSLTVSVGVATAEPSDGRSLHELILQADAALYRAKAAGRNCVIPFAA